MRDKKIYLLYPNCCYCVYYMIQYKVISKKYKKEAVFLGKVLEYSLSHGNADESPSQLCRCRMQRSNEDEPPPIAAL
jgi:hypothetical protein